MLISNQNFYLIKEAVLTSESGNLTLGEAAKTKVYRVLTNDAGQILLDPIDIEKIPEEQRWLWKNPEALAMVLRGLEEAKEGKLAMVLRGLEEAKEGKGHYLGSFAQYVDLEIDD